MNRILAMCPSRSRPKSLNTMIDSLYRTSSKADIAVYIDDDQAEMYAGTDARAMAGVGPRHGLCMALNSMVCKYPGYLAYGLVTDDSTFESPGWDRWVTKTSGGFRNGIGAIAPWCQLDKRMDFPWFTSKWIEVVGEFCPLRTEHFFWDLAMEIVGDHTAIRYATRDEFEMRHYDEQDIGSPEDRHGMGTAGRLRSFRVHQDARFACAWLSLNRRALIARLQEAIGA